MKKSLSILVIAVLLAWAAPAQAEARALSGSKYNILLLTPGHSQTLYFELGNTVFNSSSQYHSLYLLTIGAGTLNLRVGPATSIGQYAGMVYAAGGLIGVKPVGQYGYNAETVTLSAPVGQAAAGVVLTAITVSSGSPDYPVIMSMVVSLN